MRRQQVGRNRYRHEWVSLRLFEAFVGPDVDSDWLARLAAPTTEDDATWLGRLRRDGLDRDCRRPLDSLSHAPLAQAVGWLVVSHHRLPVRPSDRNGDRPVFTVPGLSNILAQVDANWNESWQGDDHDADGVASYWRFPRGLPTTSVAWRRNAARVARRLQAMCSRPDRAQGFIWVDNPYVMHLSRLCLMLADHHYSARSTLPECISAPESDTLYANTDRSTGCLRQTLDEHLLGVLRHSRAAAVALPALDQHLPRLLASRALNARVQDERFRWQNKAADVAATMHQRASRHGAFIVNMASTGCGKTLANARMMYALADPATGMRCAFGMGLRTLTLQTGRAFRNLLNLGDDSVAIQVGGAASRALFEHYQHLAEQSGSASCQPLLDEDSVVDFGGTDLESHPLLDQVVHDPQIQALVAAPLLVCTIDHLTPSTESQRGGSQIAPMLRLMSGDLVLDEPDDFDISDLPALTRLVHWAGLFGSRVLLSSATLPPALVQGLFLAYRAGRVHFQFNRNDRPGGAAPPPDICCAWVDEFRQIQVDCQTPELFESTHAAFASQRRDALRQLAAGEARRRCELIDLSPEVDEDDTTLYARYASLAMASASELHARHHTVDALSGRRVSFGLVRMANIGPLYEVALALFRAGAPTGHRVHLCVYHSQYPLLLRSAIEHRLDLALNRVDPLAVFRLPDIRARLASYPEHDHLFLVLGSPVTEVGRDHDYDWAVIEPSSVRSLIQLAGRVRRHRPGRARHPTCESSMRTSVTAEHRRSSHFGDQALSPASSHSRSTNWTGYSTRQSATSSTRDRELSPPNSCGHTTALWTWSTRGCGRSCCPWHRPFNTVVHRTHEQDRFRLSMPHCGGACLRPTRCSPRNSNENNRSAVTRPRTSNCSCGCRPTTMTTLN